LEPKNVRRLRMTFETEDGPWTLSLSEVKEGLIPEEVESVMQTIINNSIFGIPRRDREGRTDRDRHHSAGVDIDDKRPP